MRRLTILLLPFLAVSCSAPARAPLPARPEACEESQLPLETRLSAQHYLISLPITYAGPSRNPIAGATFDAGIELPATIPCATCGGSGRSGRVVVWAPTRQWDHGHDAGIMDPTRRCAEFSPVCETCRGKGEVAR